MRTERNDPVKARCRFWRLQHGFVSLAAVLLVLAVWPFRLAGHGLDAAKPTREQLAQVGPPLTNSLDFAEQLQTHWRNRCDAEQLATLDQIRQLLDRIRVIRRGHLAGYGTDEGEFFRWQLETNLVGLVGSIADAVTIDFRPGAARMATPPLDLNQQFNLILLKVLTGNGSVGFEVHEMDVVGERSPENYTVKVRPNAVTYVLLKLRQVPSDRTILHLQFQTDGETTSSRIHTLEWKTSPLGQLALEVLDEDGLSAPVLLRLTSGEGQRLFEPPNAVDLTPLMNEVTGLPIYGPGRGYPVFIPGPFRGRYWLVTGPFDMALPPGPWEVHILRGLETIPIHDTFRVQAGEWTRKTYHLKRWTNMAAQGWFSGDDHVHSRLMSSDDAHKLLAFARAGDIHISNILEMGNEMRTWYAQRGFGPEFRVQDGDYWLVPGQEDPRSMLGHAIGLNLTAKVRDLDHYYLNDWIAAKIHRQGGLYGHTHVGNSEVKTLFTERQMALFTPMGIVDFNSILQNKLGVDLYYDFLNLGFKMTASSGSDTPYGGTVGAVRVYAFCGTNQPFSPDAWFDALKQGHTFVTTGPMLDLQIDDAIPGDEIALTNDRPMRVRLRAWGREGAGAPTKLQLIQFGRPVREVVATDDRQGSLEFETMLNPQKSCWLAAYARGQDGSEAHSTPIYLVKAGERFWDTTQAAELVQKQLAVLAATEHAVEESEKFMQAASRPDEYWHRWPAQQAKQIRERIEDARRTYRGLLEELPAK